jgi:DNA primase large subunit
LTPILQSISKQHIGKEYNPNAKGDSISYSDVDNLVQHFPPCMRTLHYALKAEAHLKHFGRLQYGLFLKGIGLPVEEALIFWRKAFHKKSDDEFQKQYAYNVRYNYGMEGSRKNYAPYSCMKIITSNAPSSGDHHGCPFKHYSTDSLRDMLINYGAPEAGVIEMTKLAKEGHYQIACTRYFELTHGKAVEKTDDSSLGMDIIEHPNAWFDFSIKGVDKKTEKMELAD